MSRTKKKDVGMGLFVQCLYALSLHLVAVVFGTAIPTSLYIFGKINVLFTLYVGMAVCRQDRLYKDYTSNPIPILKV